MSDTQRDGGPAFPTVARDGNWQPHHDGMTLRDYFAAKALNGFLSDAQTMAALREAWGNTNIALRLSEACYEWADAMLKARDMKK